MIYVRLAIAAAVVAFFAGTHYLAHQIGADSVRLDVAQQALKQIERAQDRTRQWQETAHEAQQNYTQAQAAIALRDDRIRALNKRMQQQAPSAEQLANASAAAVSRYAAETERDFAECRGRLAEVGRTAAAAAASAWACYEAWPVSTGAE